MKTIFAAGDSISFNYCPYLEKMIGQEYLFKTKEGKEEASRNLNYPDGANCGDSSMLLAYLQDEKENNAIHYDYFVFNCGLHDIKVNNENGTCQVSAAQYKKNLLKILQIMKEKNVKVIWISTTSADDQRHNSLMGEFKRYNKDILCYNEIAKEIMQQHNIPIIDLYSFTKGLGNDVYCDHIHYKENVQQLQAAYIYGFLKGVIL